ncbi:FxsA family protein [Thiomicrorhabdus sp. zzn3]|uniref:FxsA family protein n=1 Tax=Thiomicrorhabdus sp. zzn3 TaxID=3039775 RepID=UPI00243730DC|nr:FxsA family protein [Thiomicrorhabdus sp. zzn3]MDG6779060.1 FxsA family protein [Thiomicrorhabdus sp. zzn3]
MKVFLLFFILIPLLELYLLIQVGGVIGALPTVLLTVATAVIGVWLMRSQGVKVLQDAQLAMTQGEAPQTAMMEGVFIFLGGVLLLVPGLMTDALGLLFLIPWVRQTMIRQSLKGLQMRGHYRYQNSRGDYFEGEWREAEEKPASRLQHRNVIDGEFEEPKKDSKE